MLVCDIVQDVLQCCSEAQQGCRALLTCMEPLERVFKDADNVALSSLVSTVQIPGGPGPATQASPVNTAAVSMFDDDLDVGAPAAVSGANRCDIPFNGNTGGLGQTSQVFCECLPASLRCSFSCPVNLFPPCSVYVSCPSTCPPPASLPYSAVSTLTCAALLILIALPSPALPCPVLPFPSLPCPALPCPALPCPALPCPALPCPALSFLLHSWHAGLPLLARPAPAWPQAAA